QALTQNLVAQAGEAEDGNDSLDRRLRVAKLTGSVSFVGGRVPLGEAKATLEVPAHFRYARGDQLREIAEAMGRGITPGTIGWLLHDQVSLSEQHPWIVEVHWYPLGHVVEGDSGRLAAANLVAERNRVLAQAGAGGPVAFEWLRFVYQPEWSAERGALTWAEQTRYDEREQTLADCYADLPGRTGVLRYSVVFVEPERDE